MADYLNKTTEFLKTSPGQLMEGAKSGNWLSIVIVAIGYNFINF